MKAAKGRGALFVAIGCMGLAVGGSARGAAITETVPFTILAPTIANSPAQTITVLTPQFNPTLGTFIDGATTITGTVSTALEFFNTGAGGAYDVVLTDTLTLAGIPGGFGNELTGTVPANQTVFTVPVTLAFGPVDRGDPAQLVVGSGTWGQLFSLPFPALTINQNPGTVIIPGLAISGTSLTTYNYTPAATAVPEPGSYCTAVLLLGCAVALSKWRGGQSR